MVADPTIKVDCAKLSSVVKIKMMSGELFAQENRLSVELDGFEMIGFKPGFYLGFGLIDILDLEAKFAAGLFHS